MTKWSFKNKPPYMAYKIFHVFWNKMIPIYIFFYLIFLKMKKTYNIHFIKFILQSYVNIQLKNIRAPYMAARHLKDTGS